MKKIVPIILITVLAITKGFSQIKAKEKPPKYLGGIEEFYTHISSNLNLSSEEIKNLKGEKIFIQFVIDEKGNVKKESVSSVEGMTTVNNEELIRKTENIIKASPSWIAGTRNGEPVEMRQVVPIVF